MENRIFKNFRNLVLKNRSYRRFYQDFSVKEKILKGLVDLARLSPSAANLQPLKYILSCEPERNARIFPCLKWAGYLRYWPGPEEGEKPSAYIIILGDTRICKSFGADSGIAAQSILLGANERGLGGCMIGSIDRDGLRKNFAIPSRYEIILVIALGKPREKIVIEKMGIKGSVKYWRDGKKRHHVPKRMLEDIIIGKG